LIKIRALDILISALAAMLGPLVAGPIWSVLMGSALFEIFEPSLWYLTTPFAFVAAVLILAPTYRSTAQSLSWRRRASVLTVTASVAGAVISLPLFGILYIWIGILFAVSTTFFWLTLRGLADMLCHRTEQGVDLG
jgi:hypothetical protein